jgi:hypothetical protein
MNDGKFTRLYFSRGGMMFAASKAGAFNACLQQIILLPKYRKDT